MFGLESLFPSVPTKLLGSALIAVAVLGIAYLVRRGRRRVVKRIGPVTADLASAIATVAVVIVAALAVADVWGQTGVLLDQFGVLRLDARAPQVAVSVVVVIAIQVFADVARRLLGDLARESNAMTEHQREVGYRLTQLGLWTVGILVILGIWEVNLGGLLVGAGFLGIVLGLAAQQTLGSLFAGVVLMFSRPFEIGDWIAVEQQQGIVTDITMTNTRIQSFDGEYVVIPNEVISSQTVTNQSRRGRLRVDVEVSVDYGSDVERAREVALEVAEELASERADVLTSPRPQVLVREFAESAITLSARVWVDDPTVRRVNRTRDALVTRIKAAFEEAGIKIPYPQRELSGRAETGGLRIADRAGDGSRSDPGSGSTEREVADGDGRPSETAPSEGGGDG